MNEINHPSIEHVAWVFEKISEHIKNGGGTFRKLIYDRMGFEKCAYQRLYEAGGMAVTNAIEDAKEAERLREALERVMELWKTTIQRVDEPENHLQQEYFAGKAVGIMDTLNALGIKIPALTRRKKNA